MQAFLTYIEDLIHTGWVATALSVALIVVITATAAHFARRFLSRVLAVVDGSNVPSSSIFINIARAAVWIAGMCVMLSTCFQVDVSAAITALGIGGIAISLGFQDTIANLIGGLQVSLLRIVKPGDNIEVGASSGVVQDVTWRHTTIKNSAGEEVLVPNSIISKTALVHLPPANKARARVVVALDGRDPGEVAAAIEHAAGKAAARVGEVAEEPKLAFSEISAQGCVGTLSFTMADEHDVSRAIDAALRAVAPVACSSTQNLTEI